MFGCIKCNNGNMKKLKYHGRVDKNTSEFEKI